MSDHDDTTLQKNVLETMKRILREAKEPVITLSGLKQAVELEIPQGADEIAEALNTLAQQRILRGRFCITKGGVELALIHSLRCTIPDFFWIS